MDYNDAGGLASGTYGMSDIPLGFGFSLAMNESAMGAYASLSEQEKEQIIMRCRDAKSKEEMQRIVDSLVTDRNAQGFLEEQRDSLS